MRKLKIAAILIAIWIMIIPGFSAVETMASDGAVAVSFVKVDGEKVYFPDGKPFIESGRTLVPVRFIAEALGYNVDWIQESKTVTINDGQILLPVDSSTATVNGESVPLDVPARLVVTDGMTRTFVPLRFVSEMLNCTVDWFNENRSIVINSLLPDGKEVSFYHRCKQSELFYEKIYDGDNWNPEWDSELYLKSALTEQTDSACVDADWAILRTHITYEDGTKSKYGAFDISVLILKPTLQARHEVKELLQTFYPTGHERVYDILMRTIREELFENYGLIPATISGTFGTHYIDDREVYINKHNSTLYTSIKIKDSGDVNPQKPDELPHEFLKDKMTRSVAHHSSGKWYMETYELDKW